MENKIKLGFGLSIGLSLLLGIGSFWSIRNLEAAIADEQLTTQTLDTLKAVLSGLKDAETGQRGYLLTGREEYLEPYNAGIKSVPQDIAALRQLLKDQAQYQEYFQKIEALSQKRLARLSQTIQLRKTAGFAAALAVVQTNRGKAIMDEIRTIVEDLSTTLKQRQQMQSMRAVKRANQVLWTNGVLGVSVLGLLTFAIWSIQRELAARTRAEVSLNKSEAELKALFAAMTDIVLVRDREGRCLKIAPTHVTNLYQSPETMVGKTLHETFPPAEADLLLSYIHQALETQTAVQGEYLLPIGDRTVYFDTNFSPLSADTVMLVARDVTERKLAEQAVRDSEERLSLALEGSGDGLWYWNLATDDVYLSPEWTQLFEAELEQLPNTFGAWLSLVHPQDQAWVREQLEAHVSDPSLAYRFDYRLRTRSGDWKWVANYGKVVRWDDAQQPLTIAGIHRDIDGRKKLEAELFQEKELAQVTLQCIGDAVITTDAVGRIRYFNPTAETITGWCSEEASGLPIAQVFKIINEATQEPVANPIEQALDQFRTVGLPHPTILVNRDGCEVPIEDSAAPIYSRDGHVIGAVMVFRDVTQTRVLSRELSWQATHDSLTRLINRREFERRVEQGLNSAQQQNFVHALCYVDLDQFKIVNDTCGHDAGDELLRQLAALLQSQVRKTDTLARLGGDEFGILLHQCPLEQALRVAHEIRERVQAFRFLWQGQTFMVGASIGLTMINAASQSLVSILSEADAACYKAKNKGRNRVQIFQADDEELLEQRGAMQWATRITQAIEENRFCLYIQSIADISANPSRGEHYEVLLRLRDEQGQLVPPMAFMPAAERYGLMHLIDRWVIRTLFTTQGKHYRTIWQQCLDQGTECHSLYAINLSGASINDDQFIDFLHEQLEIHEIPPQLICFEITETVAISNLNKASQFIQRLQSLGCRFSLDDFGSGMSSFGYLKNLPVDYLKIDGSFIRHIVNDPVDEAMVAAMTQVGHVMGIKIIAEFVENDDILARLKTLGIDYGQGYGIAKPRSLLPEP